ncbi:MAG: hypothetical protein EHM38_01660 [Geobacteraceae bacterium]|nr:MAG: hypothetical protein EHM38_01660 [Geobacteraceae bacterium]
MKISVIGSYPVDGSPEPCYLVEILIEEFQGELDFADFTQEVDGLSKDNWQMPWDEHILDDDGLSGQLAPFPGPLKIRGAQRLAFFFHYLDLSVPLTTPMGPVPLPKPSPRPDRLAFIKYEAPD